MVLTESLTTFFTHSVADSRNRDGVELHLGSYVTKIALNNSNHIYIALLCKFIWIKNPDVIQNLSLSFHSKTEINLSTVHLGIMGNIYIIHVGKGSQLFFIKKFTSGWLIEYVLFTRHLVCEVIKIERILSILISVWRGYWSKQ